MIDMNTEIKDMKPKRRALFIGGTGTISSAVTELVAKDDSWELWLLNRGNRLCELPDNVHCIIADINDEQAVLSGIEGLHFDCVCDFIAFKPEQVERDFRLFFVPLLLIRSPYVISVLRKRLLSRILSGNIRATRRLVRNIYLASGARRLSL